MSPPPSSRPTTLRPDREDGGDGGDGGNGEEPAPTEAEAATTDDLLRPPRGGWPVRVTTTSPFGRGLVTTRGVRPGEVLEAAGLIELPHEADAVLSQLGYLFDVDGRSCIAAGAVSFVNHSYTPNAVYDMEADGTVIVLRALTTIGRGEEVRVNYHGDPDCTDPLWFDVEG